MKPPANTDPQVVIMLRPNTPATPRKLTQLFDVQNAQIQLTLQR